MSCSTPIFGKSRAILVIALAALLVPVASFGHEPDYTAEFDRGRCTFANAGSNPYFPMWPGYAIDYEGEEEDDGEMIEIANTITVLPDTELVDGVVTRVIEERESEDGELAEVSRNFFAICRETGDVWYFGEDVDDYEDGEVVGHEGAWRAGINGAQPGIVMPGTPMIGARHFQENAPGVARDFAEIVSLDATVTVPAGTFEDLLYVEEGSDVDPTALSTKYYSHGIGLVQDDALQMTEIHLPECLPDATTHCLNDGRFKVEVEWRDFSNNEGDGNAILASDDSGEFWFFSPNNTEMLVKVLDACEISGFNNFWVFAAGLTDVEVTLTVTDTDSMEVRVYENDLGSPFTPVTDTAAFDTCP